jgi:hypothetical protein
VSRRLTLVASEELDGVDEAPVEGARPPHPRRAHAAPGGREPQHVAGGGQAAAEVLVAAGAVVSTERIGERTVQVELAGAREHPVVRGRREERGRSGIDRPRRGGGCGGAQRRGPRRGSVGVVELDLRLVTLPVIAAGALERGPAAGRAAVDGHPVDWPRPRRLRRRRGVEGDARHGHRQERRCCLCRGRRGRGGRGIHRLRPQPPRRGPFLPRRRRRERQLGGRRGSVQPPPRVASPPDDSSSAETRGGRRRRSVAARQTDVQRQVRPRRVRLHRCSVFPNSLRARAPAQATW